MKVTIAGQACLLVLGLPHLAGTPPAAIGGKLYAAKLDAKHVIIRDGWLF